MTNYAATKDLLTAAVARDDYKAVVAIVNGMPLDIAAEVVVALAAEVVALRKAMKTMREIVE